MKRTRTFAPGFALALAAVLAALPLRAQTVPAQQPVPAQAAGDYATETARIARARNAAEALYKTEEKACYQKFAVTDCVNEARDRRRAVMTELHRQEVAFNDAERKRKAAERLQSIAEKSSSEKKAEKKADSERARVNTKEREARAVEKKAARAPAPAPRPGASAQRQAEIDEKLKGKAADLQSRSQAAAQALKERQEREAKARAHKEALARRLAERKKPPAAPLPPPP
ncbi:MAG: hypothetical protein V4684_19295 [Pseudomonadota bacterium]